MANQTATMFTLLLAGIASVSLLVGGIGIMNIMLVSVTERTREIGIRKALGARRRDIQLQFLVEALVLSMAGGAIGILLGMAGAWAAGKAFSWNTTPSLISIILSFGFAAIVGIFFGFYPARKASRLDPVDALRYE
jgi:putative ABC transport system permease protein